MEKDLLVICPTKGRPKVCERMIESFDKKSSSSAELIFIIDQNEQYFLEYLELFTLTKHSFTIRNQKSLCEMYNHIITLFPNYKYYSETNDDFIYRTKDWDRILIKKLEEKGGGIAYGDDGYAGSMLPTTSVISGKIIQAVGWIHMPTLGYLCNDVVWRVIGHKLNCLFYIPEVKIEHMHPFAKKAEKDKTFEQTNSKESYIKDNKALNIWRKTQMKDDCQKIREVLNGINSRRA